LFSSPRDDVLDEARFNNGLPKTFDNGVASKVLFKLLTPSRVSVSYSAVPTTFTTHHVHYTVLTFVVAHPLPSFTVCVVCVQVKEGQEQEADIRHIYSATVVSPGVLPSPNHGEDISPDTPEPVAPQEEEEEEEEEQDLFFGYNEDELSPEKDDDGAGAGAGSGAGGRLGTRPGHTQPVRWPQLSLEDDDETQLPTLLPTKDNDDDFVFVQPKAPATTATTAPNAAGAGAGKKRKAAAPRAAGAGVKVSKVVRAASPNQLTIPQMSKKRASSKGASKAPSQKRAKN
jgi:hypothetical protein